MVVSVLCIFESQTTIADVTQIFQPLEIGHNHPSAVDYNIGQNKHVLFQQHLMRFVSDRTIGALCNDSSLNLVSIAGVNDRMSGARTKNIALLVE